MTHQDHAAAAAPRRKPFDPENVGKTQRTSELDPIAESDIKAALRKARCGIVRRPRLSEILTPAAKTAAAEEYVERDWLMVASKRQPNMQKLLLATSLRTGISLADLRSPRRDRKVVRARMIFMALAKQLTTQSLPQIGRYVGGKDHSTVLHALRTVDGNPRYFQPEFGELRAAFLWEGNTEC